MASNKVKEPARKLEWRAPKVEQLGNLRDFVRTGNGFGKSGTIPDGGSHPGGEKHQTDR